MEIKESVYSRFSAPLLLDYVYWILQQAQERKLKTLYFLARDGYLLRKIAISVCKHLQLSIECRYLYCSRSSLRMPSYWLIGEEAYDLLLLGGYQVSIFSVLSRADLTQKEMQMVCRDCELDYGRASELLTKGEFRMLCERLRRSTVYRELVQAKSVAAYEGAEEYFRAEGLVHAQRIALVDSGWTGSMQRSIRQLLEHMGFRGELMGFYYGMYACPKEKADGAYYTFLFNQQGKLRDKIHFCNNLFECMLSAPHGMTVGYRKDGTPLLRPYPKDHMAEAVEHQIEETLLAVEQEIGKVNLRSFSPEKAKKRARRLITRYMAHPTAKEAAQYQSFFFCDDITEAYCCPLVDSRQIQALKGYSLPARVLRRLGWKGRNGQASAELFWPYGTMAFLPPVKRWWYRWNVYIWEWIRYVNR